MLITLPAGIALTVTAFLLLYRLSPLNGKQSALVTALVVLSAYLPVVLLDWPGADVFAIHLALFLVTAYVLGIVSAVGRRAISSVVHEGAVVSNDTGGGY